MNQEFIKDKKIVIPDKEMEFEFNKTPTMVATRKVHTAFTMELPQGFCAIHDEDALKELLK